MRIKEVLIRKNREHAKTEKEVKQYRTSHAEISEKLDAGQQKKIDVEECLNKVESESQTGVAPIRSTRQ